jgi:hypothetical protein
MIYQKLQAGDTRQKGDEVRGHGGRIHVCHGLLARSGQKDVLPPYPKPKPDKSWEPVQLLGHAILASDLMHAEFRRLV